MSEGTARPDVPDWDDEYLDRVADRLQFNYDLAKDRTVGGERFPLYGRMRMESHKQFLHPALSYGHQRSTEHLHVRRAGTLSPADLERYVELGHDLADGIDADEEHFSTDFVFAFVVGEIDPDVEEFVASFTDRILIRRGYYGHYEINLLVVAPEEEALVASPRASVATAFRLWDDGGAEKGGVVDRVRRLFGR